MGKAKKWLSEPQVVYVVREFFPYEGEQVLAVYRHRYDADREIERLTAEHARGGHGWYFEAVETVFYPGEAA